MAGSLLSALSGSLVSALSRSLVSAQATATAAPAAGSEAYIVEQLKADRLQPAGTDGHYQPVKLISRRTLETDSRLALLHDGKSEPLSFEMDAYFSNRFSQAPKVDAPLVFVGWGLDIPERGYSDLQGLDLKGKVAVLLYGGSPSEIPGPLSAHYNDIRQRWAALKKAGAIGITAILNPHSMDIPWERVKMLRTQVGMAPADETLDDTAGIELGVAFNPASADKLFAGSGHTFHKISDLAKARKSLPRFPLKVEIRARAKMDVQHLESSNVVAKLEGSDPKLRNDCVVMSAHIDSATTHQSLSALVYQVVTNVITRRQTTRISLSTWKQPVSSRALFGTYSPLLLIARRLLTGSRIASSSALFSISAHGH